MTATVTSPLPPAPAARSLVRTILWVGLLVGTLDICCAFISSKLLNNVSPDRVLKYIASGVFGREAFGGGTMMAIYGLVFHYVIAYGATIFFFWIYPRLTWLSKNNWLTGLVYALFVWIVTTRIIVPLSNVPPSPFRFDRALLNWGILVVAIGWPLAWCAHRFYYPKSA